MESTTSTAPLAHSRLDDVQALVTAIVLVALGLSVLGSAGLMTGGVPGLAFLLHYASGLSLGQSIFLVNLPFYFLAWRAIGLPFVGKTLVAVTCLALAVEGARATLVVQATHPFIAAVSGGTLIGVGLLVLFRHGASLGGIGVLAICLHRRFGWRVGVTQLALDVAILGAAFALLEPSRALASIAGCVTTNLVLAWNHRPGRYAVDPTCRV